MPLFEFVCKHGHITEAYTSMYDVEQIPCSSKGCDEMAVKKEYSLPAKRDPKYGIIS